MKKRTTIALTLFILLTTITSQQKIIISKFNLKKISIENNFLIKESDIKKLLGPIYNRNLILLKNSEIKDLIMENSFVESLIIKKKYPDSIRIKIYEKKPIAILIHKKRKFFLSEKIDLIDYEKINNTQNLPYVIGNEKKFKILYTKMNEISFPLKLVKKFTLHESNRWDLLTKNDRLIKLPSGNYTKSLKNFLNIKNNSSFKKYKVFDYRINNQLILR